MNAGSRETPVRRSRAYRWLAENFEDRSVAEMSIWFCIAATASFIFIMIAMTTVIGPSDERNPADDTQVAAGIIGGAILWLGFVIWLGASFVRIARRWDAQRLGTEIFTLIQRGWLVTIGLTMLVRGVYFKEFNIFLGMLVVFDVVILEMIVVFLLLAWLARCKIPWHTYWDIAVIVLVFALQVWLLR